MYNFKTLHCYHCKSVVFNLPEMEIMRLEGMHYRCECCGHMNLLNDLRFLKSIDESIPFNVINAQILLDFQASCL